MSAPLVRVSDCAKLFDMRDGYPFARNVWGFSDPSVARIGDRWTMFIGGMTSTFRTNIYSFELPAGAPIDSDQWQPSPSGVISARRMRPIVTPPKRGAWNRCMHSVCYVRGMADGEEVERIYHAGRASETVLNGSLPYRIGYLERKRGRSWRSLEEPLKLHGPGRASVPEPKVEYHSGRWHMRFLSLPASKAGSEDPSKFRILYTSSLDGRDGWTTPTEWFGAEDGFYDSVVVHDDERALMFITRDSDLEGRENNPPQGVWVSQAADPADPRLAWSPPARIFAEDAGYEWTARGMCAPSAVWSDSPRHALSVFFAGAPRHRTWYRLVAAALRQRRRPPVPSPLYFTIGRLDLEIVN